MQVNFGKTKVTTRENTQKRLFPAINRRERQDKKTMKYDHLKLTNNKRSQTVSSPVQCHWMTEMQNRTWSSCYSVNFPFASCQDAIINIKYQKVRPTDRHVYSVSSCPSIMLSAVHLCWCNIVQKSIYSLHSFPSHQHRHPSRRNVKKYVSRTKFFRCSLSLHARDLHLGIQLLFPGKSWEIHGMGNYNPFVPCAWICCPN